MRRASRPRSPPCRSTTCSTRSTSSSTRTSSRSPMLRRSAMPGSLRAGRWPTEPTPKWTRWRRSRIPVRLWCRNRWRTRLSGVVPGAANARPRRVGVVHAGCADLPVSRRRPKGCSSSARFTIRRDGPSPLTMSRRSAARQLRVPRGGRPARQPRGGDGLRDAVGGHGADGGVGRQRADPVLLLGSLWAAFSGRGNGRGT